MNWGYHYTEGYGIYNWAGNSAAYGVLDSRKTSQIKEPATKVLASEALGSPDISGNGLSVNKYFVSPQLAMAFRHSKGNNVLFCDGHVTYTRDSEINIYGLKTLPVAWFQVVPSMY
jgi:prepilin-type processing-associated H-X9-DG protein